MNVQNAKDMTSVKFNGCEVLSRQGSNKRGLAMWRVLCFCGEEFDTAGASIRSGRTKSCGCTRNVWAKEMGNKNRTHGETGDRLYVIWRNMKSRCYNRSHKSYKDYGGRGITVCDEWINDYKEFRNWAKVNGYSKELTIDRIDNDGNYNPDNCRWASVSCQQRNKRSNVYVLYGNETLTKAEVMERTGITKYQLNKQIVNGVFVKESDLG